MVSLIPAAPLPDDVFVTSDSFWPTVSMAAFKKNHALGDQFPPERVSTALSKAVLDVNELLTEWRARQGVNILADVPAPKINGVSAMVWRYEFAVFCAAGANLQETANSTDVTGAAHDRAAFQAGSAAYWRQRAWEAVAEIQGKPRIRVGLI